jgi:hypothetical protein
MLHYVAVVRTDVSDDGGTKFFKNVDSYKSHAV